MSGRIISGEEAQALLSATCEDPTPCTGPGCMGGCVEDQFKALMRLRDAAPDLAYTVDHQAATIADQGREIERLSRALTTQTARADGAEAEAVRLTAERDRLVAEMARMRNKIRECDGDGGCRAWAFAQEKEPAR